MDATSAAITALATIVSAIVGNVCARYDKRSRLLQDFQLLDYMKRNADTDEEMSIVKEMQKTVFEKVSKTSSIVDSNIKAALIAFVCGFVAFIISLSLTDGALSLRTVLIALLASAFLSTTLCLIGIVYDKRRLRLDERRNA